MGRTLEGERDPTRRCGTKGTAFRSTRSGQRVCWPTMLRRRFIHFFCASICSRASVTHVCAAGTVRVEETCYKGHFGTPKTRASRREVPLTPVVTRALQAHRVSCRDTANEALVFVTRRGTPLASNNLRKRQLHPASQRAGFGSINWHSLRHTHGTLLREQGTPLRVAQAQLGHSDMTTTLQVYTHASGSAQRQAVDHLESLLFPSVPKFAEVSQRPN